MKSDLVDIEMHLHHQTERAVFVSDDGERQNDVWTHKLASEGMLVEGGFAVFLLVAKIDIDDPIMPRLRDAYMHGAEHLWSGIMAILDPGENETPGDMRRMDLIQKELEAWRKAKMEAFAKAYPTQGSA